MTPSLEVSSSVEIQVQYWAHKWLTVKTVTRLIGAGGKYTWRFKPANKGSYRLRVTIARSATHAAAITKWNAFKVK